ncbi:hypothetical protein B1219_25940 [Pseudomonas ogarae]|nr:hypothetical protein B1219_25940 [Pseudomonas ogarae]OPG77900.1 hypothetical protein B1218_18465 [Pseudomonas ogarae]
MSNPGGHTSVWRGSLLPLGCAAAPKILRTLRTGAPARSSGSKLPRHNSNAQVIELTPGTQTPHPPSPDPAGRGCRRSNAAWSRP